MKLWAILLLAVAAVQASPIQDESVPATTDAGIHPDDNLVLSEPITPESETDLATTTNTTELGRKARILVANLQVPAEVVITSGVVGVEGEEDHKGRTMFVGSDGIPIVEGVRMPDDPNDTRTFRNARVINGELVPNESNDTQTGDIYIYGPAGAASGRAINSQSSQDNTFKPSMPYPAFYYQDYYKNGNPDLPDNVGVESVTSSAQQATNSLPFVTEKNSNILQQGYKIHGSSSVNGRPVYYVSKDESAQLHDDRAPYDYEPQQTTTAAPVDPNTNSRIQSYYSQKQQAPQQQQPQQEYQYPQQYYDYQQQNNKPQQQQYQQQEYQQQNNKQQQQYQQQQYQPQQYQQPAQEKYQSIQQQYQQPAQEKYQSQQQYPQQQYPQQQYPQQYPLQGNIAPADPGAFVIKQQTYQAGGTTYQIPVPVPKDQQEQYYYNYQQQPYYNQRPNPNPIKQFSNKIKQGIQGGADKIHDFTSPVVDPLTEAGHKISYNLGLAQKFDKFSEKVADPIVAPLVVASAASLALGALGVGFALRNQNVSIGVGSPLAGFSGFAKELQNKTLNRMGRSVEDDNGETNANLVNNLLSGLSLPQKHFLTSLQKVGFENWKETPCAKRIFCDVMAQEDELTIGLMEKRMATFLTMMDTGMAESLQSMTQDMMEAIRERKCDQFQCGQDHVVVSESLTVPNEGPR